MERRVDDLSFEGAWAKQLKEEKKELSPKEQKEVNIHEDPAFRGQRDIVEKRTEIKMVSKQEVITEKKKVEVVAEPSSKEGDDFEIEW
ncbi:MAG: hypothetical protein ACKVG2_03555 [Candidatus Poseidoniales archaeon]|jgi:hypothetical protein|tara:strand:- start:93 stop:356 length:264 start_codon:yes stop_codon:yes gene_type:complete